MNPQADRTTQESLQVPIFFVGYAMAVWIIAARFRRQIPGFAAILVGTGGLLALNFLHSHIQEITQGEIYLPVLRSIMYPYTALVAGVGIYIFCLPQRSLFGCETCGYDLHGLSKPGHACRCPECGTISTPTSISRRSGTDRTSLTTSDKPAPPSPLNTTPYPNARVISNAQLSAHAADHEHAQR
jgi:hypothetical protein